MRILLINEVCGIGSTGRICTEIATELEKQGNEVKIAYGRCEVPKEYKKYSIRIGNKLDIIIHALLTRFFDLTGFGSKIATKKFINWVRIYNPDVIHLHNLHGYYINIELLFNYLAISGKKIIWTLHDCWAYTGHSAYCDVVKCERWKNGCHNCPQLRTYPKAYLDRSKQNWARKRDLFTKVKHMTIICPSKWLAGQVKESFLKKYNIVVVHNGIDTKIFHRANSDFRGKHGLENYYLVLGVANVWTEFKGFSDFIQLASLIPKDSKIVLVGSVSKEKLREIPSNIIIIPNTHSPKEMASIYSSCNVFFNPTRCESFGLTNIEAASCGLNVIAYDVGGCSESVELANGFLVKCGDVRTVAERIEELKKLCKINTLKDIDSIDKKTYVKKNISEYYQDCSDNST